MLWLLLCLLPLKEDKHTTKEQTPTVTDTVKAEKPKYLWFDAEANFERFSNRDSIRYYLDKTKEAGFNQIVVDVRPIYGDVLYKKTKRMKQLKRVRNVSRNVKWDYLQVFIDESKKRGLKVSVSTTLFPAGDPSSRRGPAYEDPYWAKRTAIQNTPQGLTDIKDDVTKVAAFINPLLPEAQEYALGFIRELVTNYDFEGYVLDYCRYSDVETDFSDFTRKKFEAYIGRQVPNFPQDIFSWEKTADGYARKDGPFAKQWFEFRSMVIHDFIKRTKEEIKAIKPQVKLEYWSASWYGSMYEKGQNWASEQYDASKDYSWATPAYMKSGFAEQLDVFMNGVYLERAYGINDPESIEYGLARGNRLINGACAVYGSIYANNFSHIEDDIDLCLNQSEGLVVFDIVQVIDHNLWDRLKRGIDKAEALQR
ncbi:alpha amylase family protein [Chitinophaga sp. MM2321]|uniref:alpha amylase family protein n=1 Tax=Chitinophaga sp. MM2321 TaxID=3137178 RepID=UPI0032D57176